MSFYLNGKYKFNTVIDVISDTCTGIKLWPFLFISILPLFQCEFSIGLIQRWCYLYLYLYTHYIMAERLGKNNPVCSILFLVFVFLFPSSFNLLIDKPELSSCLSCSLAYYKHSNNYIYIHV